MTPDSKKTLSSLRVLIVEDAPLVAKLIKLVLGSIGVGHAVMATDGVTALEKIDQADEPFELVICDWMMPGMDGLAFLEQFRGDHKDTPFVMLTAKTASADFSAAKRLGATYFLMKPLEPDDLRLRLQAVIEATIL